MANFQWRFRRETIFFFFLRDNFLRIIPVSIKNVIACALLLTNYIVPTLRTVLDLRDLRYITSKEFLETILADYSRPITNDITCTHICVCVCECVYTSYDLYWINVRNFFRATFGIFWNLFGRKLPRNIFHLT